MIAGAFQEKTDLIAAFVTDGTHDILGLGGDVLVHAYDAEILLAAEPGGFGPAYVIRNAVL